MITEQTSSDSSTSSIKFLTSLSAAAQNAGMGHELVFPLDLDANDATTTASRSASASGRDLYDPGATTTTM